MSTSTSRLRITGPSFSTSVSRALFGSVSEKGKLTFGCAYRFPQLVLAHCAGWVSAVSGHGQVAARGWGMGEDRPRAAPGRAVVRDGASYLGQPDQVRRSQERGSRSLLTCLPPLNDVTIKIISSMLDMFTRSPFVWLYGSRLSSSPLPPLQAHHNSSRT